MRNHVSPAQLREAKFIPFHVPQIDEEEIRSVVETLRSGWLTTGIKTKQFEEDFAPIRVGVEKAVAVNSYISAAELTLEPVESRLPCSQCRTAEQKAQSSVRLRSPARR